MGMAMAARPRPRRGADVTRDEIIALVAAKAHEHGIEPWEFLGGAIAESGLDPNAERDGVPPDISFGLFQQTAKFAPEGDLSGDLPRMRELYFDPVHACDVAIKDYLYWRTNPDVSPLQAWCAYNEPASYRLWPNVPNAAQRENYRAGLAEAQAILGVTPVPDPPAYNADAPPQRQVQSWTCSIRATAWILASLGLPFEIGALQDEMSPQYVTPADGLLDARGYGIAATLKAHLPPDWQDRVHVFETIAWDELRSLAGIGPVALGLRGADHWINVARTRPDGDLDSPNPSPNYPAAGPIGDTLSRAEFDTYGPASAVWVNAAATPILVPPPVYAHPGDVGDGLLAMMASDKTAPAMPSTFLPLGRSPAMIEECQGLNGVIYRWHLPTGQSWRFKAA